MIARALEPLLAKADASLLPRLGEELARFADENTRLKLLRAGGATVTDTAVVLELAALTGRAKLPDLAVTSLYVV